MTYTPHGYHIPGTRDDGRPKVRYTCGGPGLCFRCENYIHVWNELNLTAKELDFDAAKNDIVLTERDVDQAIFNSTRKEIRDMALGKDAEGRGEEVRTTSVTGGMKGVKPARHDLIPIEALDKLARLYGFGAEKYDAHNWRKGYDWSKSYASLQRHAHAFWSGEDIDEESGLPHLAGVAFHAFTLMIFMDEHPEYDDRWVSVREDIKKVIKDEDTKPTQRKIVVPKPIPAVQRPGFPDQPLRKRSLRDL